MVVNSEVTKQLKQISEDSYAEYIRLFKKYVDKIGYPGFYDISTVKNGVEHDIPGNPYLNKLTRLSLKTDILSEGMYFPFFLGTYKLIAYGNKIVDGSVYVIEGKHRFEILKDEPQKFFSVFLKHAEDDTVPVVDEREEILPFVDSSDVMGLEIEDNKIIVKSPADIMNALLIYVRLFNKYSFLVKYESTSRMNIDNTMFNKVGEYGERDLEETRTIIAKNFTKYH